MVSDLHPQDLGLKGKKVLGTGAGQGIGRACAIWLAQLGAQVVLSDLRDCSEAASEAGHGAISRILDLADYEASQSLVNELVSDDTPLYGLVNCAGVLIRQTIETITPEQLEFHNAVNQNGAFFLARATLEVLRSQGKGGRIILFTSQGAFNGGLNGSTHYAMNKAAVTAMVKSMARIAAADGITVNAVSPGAVDTAMFSNGMSEKDIKSFKERIPLGRIADPKELAAPTAFLLSEWARYITGATLHVNGGQLMV